MGITTTPQSKEKSPLLQPSTDEQIQAADENKLFKTYKRRWYVLAVYTAIGLLCNINWNTWGPISEPCQIVFGWKKWQVLFLSSLASISLISTALVMMWLMEKRGLRVSVILCIFLLTAGKAFQVIPSNDPTTRTVLINIGQLIAMMSTPVGFGGPPSISATWFPPEERNTATAIGTLVAYCGLAVAFLLGPAMVPIVTLTHTNNNNNNTLFHVKRLSDNVTSYEMMRGMSYPNSMSDAWTDELNDNGTHYDIPKMHDNITNYMMVQLGISVLLLLCVLVYFPDKPPSPPSATSSTPHHTYVQGLKRLFLDKSYIYLSVLFSLSYGVYFGWFVVLALAIKPFGVSENLAGWLGCAGTIAGCFSGIILARFTDYFKRQTKSVLTVMFFGAAVSQLFFSLTSTNIIPYSKALLFLSIVLGGIFFNGTTPLVFEMSIETVYPIAESLPAIMLLVFGFVVYFVFIVIFMFPAFDVTWMNWATVVSTGVCVPGLLIYKNKFTRITLDER